MKSQVLTLKRIAKELSDDRRSGEQVCTWRGKDLPTVLLRIACELDLEFRSDDEETRHEVMETWDWVRSHGRLESVKAVYLFGRDCARVISGHNVCKAPAESLLDALKARLMPEGYEWPRFDDGEPVRVGGEWDAGERGRQRLEALTFDNDGYTLHSDYYDDFRHYGERVRRPQVLAADGEPLEVGQTVWHVQDGREYVVVEPSYGDTAVVRDARYHDAEGEQYAPDKLTHQRPVLDADGVPIEVGDTVYLTQDTESASVGIAFHVVTAYQHGVRVSRGTEPYSNTHLLKPDQLTHTKTELPDSWERIEKDATKSTCDYLTNGRKKAAIDGTVQCPDDCPGLTLSSTCREIMTADLVRRCKALAGVSE